MLELGTRQSVVDAVVVRGDVSFILVVNRIGLFYFAFFFFFELSVVFIDLSSLASSMTGYGSFPLVYGSSEGSKPAGLEHHHALSK